MLNKLYTIFLTNADFDNTLDGFKFNIVPETFSLTALESISGKIPFEKDDDIPELIANCIAGAILLDIDKANKRVKEINIGESILCTEFSDYVDVLAYYGIDYE